MNLKKFNIYAKKILNNLNDNKYHLDKNTFLKINKLYKLYKAYIKKEEIKHSNEELYKFLNYYCEVISNIKKSNNKKYYKLSIAQSAAITHVSPPVSHAPVPQKSSFWSGAGKGFFLVNIIQGVTETFYRCDTLIESMKEIIEQLSEYNDDYGFGESQSTADKLLSNLKLMVDLFPSVSEITNETNIDINKIKNKQNDMNKFLTALKETEQQLQVIGSYLTENKGFGTKTTEILKNLGLAPIETDTISALRAIGDFYTHVGAYKTLLEKALKTFNDQLNAIQQPSSDSEELLDLSKENINKTTYRYKSNLEEFADIKF